MTKYRLKDRALQAKLEAVCPEFLEAFNRGVKRCDGDGNLHFQFEITDAPGSPVIDLTLNSDAIEEIPDYDPNKWNEYPNTMPPRGVRMRVEHGRRALLEGHEEIRPARLERRTCATWDGDRWVNEKGCGFANLRGLKKLEYVRFRPWEYEE